MVVHPAWIGARIRDQQGRVGTSTWRYLPPFSSAPFSALRDAWEALPSAALAGYTQRVWRVEDSGDAFTSGPYGTAQDAVQIFFTLPDSSEWHIFVIAPSEWMFLGDHETLDDSQVQVAAFISAVLALPLTDSNGNPFVSYSRGFRTTISV